MPIRISTDSCQGIVTPAAGLYPGILLFQKFLQSTWCDNNTQLPLLPAKVQFLFFMNWETHPYL